MYLIVDSGSTKSDWYSIDDAGHVLFSTQTLGLNPHVLSSSILNERIINNFTLFKNRNSVKKIFFYGAGCGIFSSQERIKKVFKKIFVNSDFDIKEDTYAAVYSTVELAEESIVCIMGTGSNCTYFDGTKIHQKVVSLGYILMDEASGNFYGKQLIRSYYFNLLPKKIAIKFKKQYDLSPDTIKDKIYRNENPNSYLAKFAKFLIEHKKDPFLRDMIFNGMRRFINHQILQFENAKKIPVHFVGSISYFLKEELEQVFKEYNLKLGKVIKRPIDGLVAFHKSNLDKTFP